MGGKYGTCFDISVLKEGDTYRMWLSWRPKQSLALVESKDGIHWSEPPQIVLGPRKETGWEDDINRPVVAEARRTAITCGTPARPRAIPAIGYATSPDGMTWKRMSDKPVLSPREALGKGRRDVPARALGRADQAASACGIPAASRYEPNAIGYATSPDGLNWTKHAANPVFTPDPASAWEKHKVTACQVEQRGRLARDVLHRLPRRGPRADRHRPLPRRHHRLAAAPGQPDHPPRREQWDHDACYKPYAIFDGQKWLLWYNGRHGGLEQIGVAIHEGEDLGF